MNIILTSKMPLTYGLPNQMNVFYRGDPVFKTSVPYFDMDRKVIAKFPEKPILKSGFMQKEELLIDKAAAVFIRKGNGKLIMFAFNPQFRASTHVSYKLIFNALLLN